jgi:acetoin utilization deacetylase AcuC-like enzyme
MDPKALYYHLLLSKELVGHPHLSHLKTMVDRDLVQENLTAKSAAEKVIFEQNQKAAAEAAQRAHEQDVLEQANAARQRLAAAQATKTQLPADQKLVEEADAIVKAREVEAQRQRDVASGARQVLPPFRPTPEPPVRPDGVPGPTQLGPDPRRDNV